LHIERRTFENHIFVLISGDSLVEKLIPSNFRRLETEGFLRDVLITRMRPGTTRSYIIAARLFLRYVKMEALVEAASCDRCIIMLDTWYASQSNPATVRRHEVRQAQQLEMTQQRAQQERRSSLELYEASSRAREAIVSLGIAAEHGRARLKERACLVARNHLVTILGLTNAQRAGALINMTLKEFNERQEVEGRSVVLVRKHKTFASHGYARVVMTHVTEGMVSTYVRVLRPKYVGQLSRNEEPLFLTTAGRQMTNSLYAVSLKGQTGTSVSLTRNRKVAVTVARESGADSLQMERLAEHMTHAPQTQQRYYDCSDRLVASVGVFDAMNRPRTVDEQPAPNTASTSSNDAATTSEPPDVSAAAAQAAAAAAEAAAAEAAAMAAIAAAAATAAAAAAAPPPPRGRRPRYSFSSEQLETMSRLFAGFIEKEKVLLSDVRDVLAEHAEEAAPLSDLTVKQVKDKLRVMIRNK